MHPTGPSLTAGASTYNRKKVHGCNHTSIVKERPIIFSADMVRAILEAAKRKRGELSSLNPLKYPASRLSISIQQSLIVMAAFNRVEKSSVRTVKTVNGARRGRFVPHPTTWLNRDGTTPSRERPLPSKSHQRSDSARGRRRKAQRLNVRPSSRPNNGDASRR